MPRFVLAIDQGTTSTRAIVFDHGGRVVSVAQREQRYFYPNPGWVEHDAVEIWRNLQQLIAQVIKDASLDPRDIVAIGIASQRETAVVWDRATGRPVARAIVWQDTRTGPIVDALSRHAAAADAMNRSGLPLKSYFSAPRLRWLLDAKPELRQRAERREVLFGTMETWLIWNLTGGPKGGTHVTDVTNASRTGLMNMHTLTWDPHLLRFFDIPEQILPPIRPSLRHHGTARGALAGVPIAAALGDQQAALFGQTCFSAGEAKCTYGTGSFLMLNTGEKVVTSTHGMLTTVAYQSDTGKPTYALEGSIATTGSLVQWFRDNLGVIKSAAEIETLAASVDNNGGCYIVPAFSGLFAPHWQSGTRGVITGLTGYITKAHLARAVLEATGWQTREVVDAMNADAPQHLTELKVDGGMTSDNLLMQFIADVLDIPVLRPIVAETVSLGAAYAAGLTVGYWPDLDRLRRNWRRASEWRPQMDPQRRAAEYANWCRAVELTLAWSEPDSPSPSTPAPRP